MSMILRIALALTIGLSYSFVSVAQITSERGIGSVQINQETTMEQKDIALRTARLNALDRFVSQLSLAQQKAYQETKQDNKDDQLLDYIISDLIISEDTSGGYYTIVLKSDINAKLFEEFLMETAGYSSIIARNASEIVAIMIARSTDSVQEFEDTISAENSRELSVQAQDNESLSSTENEAIARKSVNIDTHIATESNAEASVRINSQYSGSTIKQADIRKWRVTEASGISTQLSGILADIGLNIIPSEYIQGINLEAIRRDFGDGNDLRATTRIDMVDALKKENIPYVIIGTLDVDFPSVDPVTGNDRIYVTVNAEFLNLENRFPRVEAAIGPVQYAGLGPSESVARNNAIQLAAKTVGKELLDRLTNKDVK